MKLIAFLTAIVILFPHSLSVKANLSFDDMSLERRASEAHIEDVDEFILLSSITEAESNRSQTDNEGRIMIAICILNRVNDDRFPNTITGVISQSGQFSTCRRHSDGTYYSVTERTDLSDQAVIEAVRRIESGEAPEVLYFNCRSYFSGIEPYDLVGGNYFSCDGGIR
jgi:hypothetical protein